MDPHTARCLQLSTSIAMPPFNQNAYRQQRFPDSVNRSRFPVQQQQQQQQQQPQIQQQQQKMMRPVPQRAVTMPNSWQIPQAPNAVYQQHQQQQFTPAVSTRSVFSPQSQQVSPQESSPASSSAFDNQSIFSHNMSPDTQFGSEWDTFSAVEPRMKQEGLGMNFLEQDHDFTTNMFGGHPNEGLDLIHLNENDNTWDFGHPMSPDRRSLSSASSGEVVSEFPDMTGAETCAMPMLNSDVAMATVEEEDVTTDFSQQRTGRSSSRAPAARASSSRRYRRTPYAFDGHRRSSSVMSTASTMSGPSMSLPVTTCCSPVGECNDDFGLDSFNQLDFGGHLQSQAMMTEDIFSSPIDFQNPFQTHEPLIAPKPTYACDTLFLSSNFDEHVFDNKAQPIVPSSDIPNERRHTAAAAVDDFADYAEEPDLFGPLSEEQSVPSEEDMKPEDEDLVPSEQDARFEGDLYTPKFVRGHGNKREGYCGLCKPGRWLVLKNSAYWYDKSFTHGISAATGLPFDGPKETRRMSGNPDVWEGLCGCCNEWIALISNKKKGTTWFRHAYKCHSHQKAKDTPKKRRDTVAKVTKAKSPKDEGNVSPTNCQSASAISGPSPMMDAQAPGSINNNNKVPALQTIGSFF